MKNKRILIAFLAVVLVLTGAFAVLAASNPNTRNTLDGDNNPNTRKTLDWNNNPWKDFGEVLDINGVQIEENNKMDVPVYYETDLLFETESVYAAETARRRQDFQADNSELHNFEAVVEEKKESDSKKSLKEIPVYMEEELLFKTDGLFYLNRDACFYEGQNARENYTGALLAAYPTSAVRNRDEETVYFVYQTDTGYRLYLFANYENELQTPVGFPVVIGEMLSYDAFDGIEAGDSMETVAAVDPVTDLYKKQILEVWNLDPVAARALAEDGYPCTTIHYLKDGILKIEYEMQNDQSLVVSSWSKELRNPAGVN